MDIQSENIRKIYNLVEKAVELGEEVLSNPDVPVPIRERNLGRFGRISCLANEIKKTCPEAFNPEFKLGDWVEAGALWGYITEHCGELLICSPSGKLSSLKEIDYDCTLLNDSELCRRLRALKDYALCYFARAAAQYRAEQ